MKITRTINGQEITIELTEWEKMSIYYELQERGLVREDRRKMNISQFEKSIFVEKRLSPAIKDSDCGWLGVDYVVYTNGKEYVFFIDSLGRLSKGVCVTGNTKQAIAQAVFDNIG